MPPSTPTPKPRKASFTHSPIASPESPLHSLIAQFSSYMHLPTPMPLYVTMSSLAANYILGKPVWLMLTGSGGSGKTTLIKAFSRMEKFYQLGNVTGPGSFLSGTPQKDKSKQATGGVLRQMGNEGTLVFMDFTEVLSLPKDSVLQIISCLRRVHDGEWDRPIGADGGRVLHWEGKAGFLAGCTNKIDSMHQVVSEMGERWIMYRFPPSEAAQESLLAMNNPDPDRSAAEIQEAVASFFDCLDLGWQYPLRERRELTTPEYARLYAMASFAAAARSPVVRDQYSREVIDVSQVEPSTRLSEAFSQVYRGGEIIGMTERERYQTIARLTFDSIPSVRRAVLRAVAGRRDGRSIGEIQAALGVSASTAGRAVEDLELHQVLEKRGGKGQVLWAAGRRAREVWEAFDGLGMEGEI